MYYLKPSTIIVKAEADILLLGSGAEAGPGATDIGAPDVEYSKSVWDEVNNTYNINKEEQNYED